MKTVFQSPTPNLDESKLFYSKLGFEIITQDARCYAVDSNMVLEINADRYARAGLKCYAENWDAVLDNLREITQVVDTSTGHLLADPGNTWIYLEKGTPTSVQTTDNASVLGNFAGLSLEMVDLGRGSAVWQAIGFAVKHGGASQGWVGLENENGLAVNLMKPNSCPHLFFNPSFTYFNGKEGNPLVIQALRDREVPLAEEITHFNKEGLVDNVVLRDPGGFGFFVFND